MDETPEQTHPITRAQPVTRSEVAPTVVGVYDDAVQARRAIELLHRHVDAHRVSLFEQSDPSPRLDEMGRRVDSRVARRFLGLTLWGVVVGALAGVAFGAIAAAVIVAVTDAPAGFVFAVSIITGVLVITGFLPIVMVERNTAESDDWERTFSGDRHRELVVGVRAQSEEDVRVARETLETTGARRVRDDGPRG